MVLPPTPLHPPHAISVRHKSSETNLTMSDAIITQALQVVHHQALHNKASSCCTPATRHGVLSRLARWPKWPPFLPGSLCLTTLRSAASHLLFFVQLFIRCGYYSVQSYSQDTDLGHEFVWPNQDIHFEFRLRQCFICWDCGWYPPSN